MLPIALQLYTVRDKAQEDFTGTLKAVAEMGYDAVQFAGTGDLSAAELAKAMKDFGLQEAGAHIGLNPFLENYEELFAFYGEVGIYDLTISSAPRERFESIESIQAMAEEMNELGRKCKDAGFELSYHNHPFEFEMKVEDGRDAYFVLFAETERDLVKAEVDLGWVKAGGCDPETVVRYHGNRCTHYHIKELSGEKNEEGRWIQPEIGDGIIDWPALIEVGRRVGVQYWIVENDRPQIDSLESVRKSLEYLKGLDVVKEG